MKVIVIEDEAASARRLGRMLHKLGVEVDQLLHDVKQSIKWFETHQHPDLIFLDIQLSDGLSFEIFEAVEIKSAIIITTAYDEYALKAFKLNSIDYLLKPICDQELENAIAKYRHFKPEIGQVSLNFEEVKKLLINPVDRGYKKRISVSVGQRIKLIAMEDVVCFYSKDKGTFLHTLENRSYVMDTTMDGIYEELQPDLFFRISRGYIININQIGDILNYTNNRLRLKMNHLEDAEVIVSRQRVKAFKDWLG
ncbi:LytR/AlgR family response regulator transcription factor [Galbibacter sp.]|jgi:DNA-binding LytR/AlgR family response regulator|uniref:LytR/AlgR family response regulator transcription factor n=1 Tax=Galbibacter sp. TaxID=2918471 RepID=UPI003A914079